MTAKEVFARICAIGGEVSAETVDTCKIGNMSRNVTKLAVCFIATPQVIRAAAAWGAQMILTHEPTFYTHDDTVDTEDEITATKRTMIKESGMVICRFHDGMHTAPVDLIHDGFIRTTGLEGVSNDGRHIQFTSPVSVEELAELFETRCLLRCVRVIGNRNQSVSNLGLYLGAPYGQTVINDFKNGKTDCAVIGEVCEWSLGEYVRDSVQLGYDRSLIVLGHVGSEREGMKHISDHLSTVFEDVEVQYFECGEIYN